MALDTGGEKPTAPTSSPQAQQAASHHAEAPRQAQPQQSSGRHSILDIERRLARPVSRHAAGEEVTKLASVFKDFFEAEKDGLGNEFRMILMDRSQHQVRLSSILFVRVAQKKAYVHTLLVESRETRLGDREETYGPQKVYVPYTAGDVMDAKYWERVQLAIEGANLGVTDVVDAGVDVIPVELSPENTSTLRTVFWSALNAVFTVSEEDGNPNHPRLNIGMVGSSDVLKVRTDFNPPPLTTLMGLPRRNDFAITLSASAKGQGQIDEVQELTQTNGYVDLVYEPKAEPPYGQPPATQQYRARIVLTEASSLTSTQSIEFKWLAIANVGLLFRNGTKAWANVYRPKFDLKKGEVNTRDLGAVGYEVNLTGRPDAEPEPVNTRSDKFGDKELAGLVGAVIHPEPAVSLLIPEIGGDAWLNQAFLASANGDQNATRYLIGGLDNLTMGHFSKLWEQVPNNTLFNDDQVRVPGGYYTADGVDKSLEDLDYLALLNLTGKNGTEVVERWSAVQENLSQPMNMRLEAQLKMLRDLLRESLVVKNYYRLLTAHPLLIPTILRALEAGGFSVRQDNVVSDFSGGNGRGNTRLRDFAVRDTHNGVFTYGSQNHYGRATTNGFYGGRWN